jgi:GT2 family glycosyltransferase
MINTLLKYAEEIVDFSILAPRDYGYSYQTNMYLNYDKNKKYHQMKFVGGFAMFFNMKSIEKIGYFDEKYFCTLKSLIFVIVAIKPIYLFTF